jgi:hypothetical protein
VIDDVCVSHNTYDIYVDNTYCDASIYDYYDDNIYANHASMMNMNDGQNAIAANADHQHRGIYISMYAYVDDDYDDDVDHYYCDDFLETKIYDYYY